jgi:LPS-assembly protein
MKHGSIIFSDYRGAMKSARALRLLPYLLLCASLAHAEPPVAQPASEPQEVTLSAETLTLDVPADSYRAQGSVRLTQDGVSLLADSVIYRRFTGDALAQGRIEMFKDGDTLTGDRLSLNMVSQRGELMNGRLFIKKSNFRVRGKVMEKTGAESYRVENGSFTTCDGDKPSWRFEARQLEVTLDEFATARDAVFYAGELPIFYTPYLIYPVKRERQSGLLLPKLGHSSKKGIYYNQPYYWAIDPSKDVTFNVDIETARGVGTGGDFRYLRPHGSEGRLQWFGIYDTKADKGRGEIDQNHLEVLSADTTLASNIHLIADRAYYRDYGELSGDYNRQLLESSAFFDHKWERYDLTGELRYAQDLLAVNNDATLQRLPSLGFTAAGEKLGPLFLSMDSGFTNFQRISGVTGERLQLHPRLSWYAKPAGVVDLSIYGGYQERFYNASGAQTPGGLRQVGEADAGGSVSLPLERIYDGRLRHLLIPSLQYDYVQDRRQEDFPFFDFGDRVIGENAARWSISNVLTGKYLQESGAPEYRELLYLKLSQGIQLGGERRDLLALDQHHRLSDLLLESRMTPLKNVTVVADGRFDPIDGGVPMANLAAELKGEGSYLGHLGYRFTRGEVDYMEGRAVFPISRHFSGIVVGRYSFDRGALLESRYAVEYKHQCWSVIAAYSERPGSLNGPGNTSVPGNREFTVNFSLAGLGAMGPMRTY